MIPLVHLTNLRDKQLEVQKALDGLYWLLFELIGEVAHWGEFAGDFYDHVQGTSTVRPNKRKLEKRAKRFVKLFLPTSTVAQLGTGRCLMEVNNSWVHELMQYSDEELVTWHKAVLDGTLYKQRKGKTWCLDKRVGIYEGYLWNIEIRTGRLRSFCF